MSSDIESDHASTLKFLDSCAQAVNRSEYIESLLTLRKGVQQLLPYAREVDTYQFLTKLLSVLLTLESHMNWEVHENLKGPAPSSGGAEKVNELSCSFCGKSEREVLKLIAGPNTYICNECVGICNKILKDEAWASPGGGIA